MVTNQELLDSAKLRLNSLKSQVQEFLKERSPTSTVELAVELEVSVQETRQVLKQSDLFAVNENDEWVLLPRPRQGELSPNESALDLPTQLSLLPDESRAAFSQNTFPSQDTRAVRPEPVRSEGFSEKDRQAIRELSKDLSDQKTQADSTNPKETTSLLTQPTPQKHPENSTQGSTMNSSDRQEAKKIEQDHATVMRDSTVTVARIIQRILAQLRHNQNLSPTLKSSVNSEKPVDVQIKLGEEVLYKGKEGQTPEIDRLSERMGLTEALKQAIKLPAEATQSKPEQSVSPDERKPNRDVSVAVNGEEVLRLAQGRIEVNQLTQQTQEQPSQHKGLAHALDGVAKSLEQSAVEALGEESSAYVRSTEPNEAFIAERLEDGSLQVSHFLFDEKDEYETTVLKSDRQGNIELFDPAKAGEAISQFNNASKSIEQVNTSVSSAQVQFSQGDRTRLEANGIDSQQVERAANQAVNSRPSQNAEAEKYVPVVVILDRQVQKMQNSPLKNNLNKMVEGLKNAPRNLKQSLQQVGQKVADFGSSVKQTFQKANFGSERQSFRQDLSNLAVLQTAKQLIDNYGKTNSSGATVFEGNRYQFSQKGSDIAVTSKDGRGTILNLQDGKLSGNLNPSDTKQFRQINQMLNRDASINRSEVQQRKQPELAR